MKKIFYSATRDIDCDEHFFNELDNAIDYVWQPMFDKLKVDKNRSVQDIDDLFSNFNLLKGGDMYALDAPKSWGAPYTSLGGFVFICNFDD